MIGEPNPDLISEGLLSSSLIITYFSQSKLREENASFTNSVLYGLVISKGSGSLQLSGTKLYGAILNYSPNFSLSADSDVVGSVVALVAKLGSEGLVGLVAIWVLWGIYEKK